MYDFFVINLQVKSTQTSSTDIINKQQQSTEINNKY